MLFSAAEVALDEGSAADALNAAEEALVNFRKAENKSGVADTLRLVVASLLLQGKPAEASERASAEQEQLAGDARGEATVCLSTADIAFVEGKFSRALELSSSSRSAFAKLGDAKMEGISLLAEARAQVGLEAPSESLRASSQALELFRQLGDRKGRAQALHCTSDGHSAAESYDEALRAASSALGLFRDLKSRRAEAYGLEQIADLQLKRCKPQEALQAAKEAEAIFCKLESEEGEQLALNVIVRAHLAKGERIHALALAQKALEKARERGNKRWQASILGDALLQVHLAQGEPQEALESAEAALTLCRELNDQRWEASIVDNIATLSIIADQSPRALSAAKEAAELFGALQDPGREAAVHYRLGGLHHKQGDHEEALRLAGLAKSLFKQAGIRTSEAIALLAESYAQQLLEKFEAAVASADEAVALAQGAGDAKSEAAAWMSLASLHFSHMKDASFDSGFEAVKKATGLLRPLGAPRLLADALHMETLALLQAQQMDMALRSAHEAQVIFARVGDRLGEADTLRMIAMIELERLFEQISGAEAGPKQSQTIARLQTSALRSAERAVALARKVEQTPTFLAQTLHGLAQVHNACGQGDRGLAAAEEAEILFREAGDQVREANALVVSADASVVQGDRQVAVEKANRAAALFSEIGDTAGEALARSVAGAKMAVQSMAAIEPGADAEEGASVSAEPSKKAMDFEVARTMAKEIAMQAVGSDEEDIEFDSPLMDIGLDSLSAISFREALTGTSGMKLPASLVFDYPSLQAIASFMVEESMN